MSLVMLVIALTVFFVGCVLWDKYDYEIIGIGVTIAGAVISIFALAALICDVTSGSHIDEKIALYEETNVQIEEHIIFVIDDEVKSC